MLHDDFQNEASDEIIRLDVRLVCAICPCRRRRGRVERLLVGSGQTARWGVPKGQSDGTKSSTASTLKEVFEDDGPTGVVGITIFGSSSYQKEYRRNVAVHSLPVSKIGNSVLEMGIRRTRWSPLEETFRDAGKPGLRSLLPRLETTSL